MGLQVHLELQDLQVPQEGLVPLVPLVLQVELVLQVLRVNVDSLDLLAAQVTQEQQDHLEDKV